MVIRPEPKCPACGETLSPTAQAGGLVRRYGSACHACGARLAYDTAGGVYAIDADGRPARDSDEGRPMPQPCTTDLAALPQPPALERLVRALAVLDAVLSEDWESRYYSFQSAWDPDRNERVASMRNGSGDFWFIVFSAAGAFMKGFAHESPVASLGAEKQLLEGLPAAFAHSAEEPAFSMDETTFVLWNTGDRWKRADFALPAGPDPDGSKMLMAILSGDPADYVAFARDYFERDVPEDAVRAVYEGQALNDALLSKLAPQRTLASLQSDLAEIGVG